LIISWTCHNWVAGLVIAICAWLLTMLGKLQLESSLTIGHYAQSGTITYVPRASAWLISTISTGYQTQVLCPQL